MPTASLAAVKNNFGITDKSQVEFEVKGDTLILQVSLPPDFKRTENLIQRARELFEKIKHEGGDRQDFFSVYRQVREQYLKESKSAKPKNSGN